ncbi:hypothetical protein HRW23_18510 [Streptomyces lunaelactis]|uniref:hypothetical protein n=1 Tax=Streptomyces lunaelactis TaxID=1535768 RepID=UPI0015848CD4|nr:hypothetical protein [Streptomyces lunaelactis]NUK70668.1 hypothetical protein [Streptomyces lunaelactis]NUK79354.1 hypothetical protein [Streptomyces lunaelactis]
MTDRITATARICSNCDGFPTVRVTLGGRDRRGHLRTISAHCPACHGTGARPTRRPLPTLTGVSA